MGRKGLINLDKVRIDIGNVGTGPDYFAYQFVNEWGEKLCREIEMLRVKNARLEEEVRREDRIDSLFEAIAHGSEDHRRWLKEAIEAHFRGRRAT
jgi:hypothetical protein